MREINLSISEIEQQGVKIKHHSTSSLYSITVDGYNLMLDYAQMQTLADLFHKLTKREGDR